MKRIAQALPPGPPLPAPPPPPGMPPGMPPMPGMPPAAAAPAATDGPRQELNGPLDSVSKILYDYDIGTILDGDASKSPEDVALEVWLAYGGTEIGDDSEDKVGTRTKDDTKLPPEKLESKLKATDSKRWARLPAGKTIEDITTLDELSSILKGLSYGAMKSKAPAAAPPGGALPPPMASVVNLITRYASIFDEARAYDVADELDDVLKLVLNNRD